MISIVHHHQINELDDYGWFFNNNIDRVKNKMKIVSNFDDHKVTDDGYIHFY